MQSIPKCLEQEFHPRSNKEIAARILRIVRLDKAICISEVAEAAGCSSITARKNLCKMVKAGLAVEKRIGKARVFISKESPGCGSQ